LELSALEPGEYIAFSDIAKLDIAYEAALPIRAAMQRTIHRIEHVILSELLRELRLAAELKQAQVSEQLGVTQSYISDVERSSRRLDVVELRDLIRIYGVTLPEFVVEMEARLKKRRSPQTAKRT
jgi:predicted XRE-type DNA-binding protein